MFHFYVLSVFKKGDTIQGEFYSREDIKLRKYGKFVHVFGVKKIKKKKIIIIDPKNMKKPPSKVAHNQTLTFFTMYWPGCPKGPKTEILYFQKPLNEELGI